MSDILAWIAFSAIVIAGILAFCVLLQLGWPT
jgi:hypothetical protein